jgi:hypothetical protein
MTTGLREQFDRVFAQLQDEKLLLLSDVDFPNVTGLITGERVRGSWWSHKRAQDIFVVSEMLEDHPDVMTVKLLSGKVTFVYRELWNRIYSIGVAREEWQMNKLSANAGKLLKLLAEAGSIQTSKIANQLKPKPGEAVRELELRLLVYAQQIHGESGAHVKIVETWPAWAKRIGFRARSTSATTARRFLEEHVARINNKHEAAARLPWPTGAAKHT